MQTNDTTTPARKVQPNEESLTGPYVTRTGEKLDWESQLERDAYRILDFEPAVKSIAAQPMIINNRYPDCLVRTENEDIVAEIKYESELIENWVEIHRRFVAMRDWCMAQGYGFGVITDGVIYYPESHRVSLLKEIKARGRECENPEGGILRGQFEKLIDSEGRTTIRDLMGRFGSVAGPESVINMACSLLTSSTRYAVETPSPRILDCVMFLPQPRRDDVSSKRLISLEVLQERIRTHPCDRVKGGFRFVD